MKNVLLPFLFLLPPALVATQDHPDSLTLFDDLYRHDTLLEIVLQCDWDSLLAIRKTEDELDGRLFYPGRNGRIMEWEVGISARGKYRRRICNFPPIKLEFSKKDLRKAGLHPFDDLKLVTHCMNDPAAKDRIVREYLAYQMYQLLSPYAYRVQLVQVQYQDIDRSKPSDVHLGILVEEDRMLAHRLSLERSDTLSLQNQDIVGEIADIHALFQYLIGNADWDLVSSRNIDILRDPGTGKFILTPFDFDFSGFVNAYYAIPNPDYDLETVRDRVYLGGNPPSDQARERVLEQRSAMLRLIRQSPHLSMEAKSECILYLKSGFGHIKRNRLNYPHGRD